MNTSTVREAPIQADFEFQMFIKGSILFNDSSLETSGLTFGIAKHVGFTKKCRAQKTW